ncbi:hypothetical protein EJB05_43880, partial [Eragrostis curvula]
MDCCWAKASARERRGGEGGAGVQLVRLRLARHFAAPPLPPALSPRRFLGLRSRRRQAAWSAAEKPAPFGHLLGYDKNNKQPQGSVSLSSDAQEKDDKQPSGSLSSTAIENENKLSGAEKKSNKPSSADSKGKNQASGCTSSSPNQSSNLPECDIKPNVALVEDTTHNTPAEASSSNTRSFAQRVVSYSTEPGIAALFKEFLFKRKGDTEKFYPYEMKNLVARGTRRVLTVHYGHVVQTDKNLAMAICNNYPRWHETLTTVALECMNNLLKCKESLQLDFAGMPTSHTSLVHRLQNPVKIMPVYGHTKDKIMIPKDDPLAVVEDLFHYAINMHRNGRAYGGFDVSEIDVISQKAKITKSPDVVLSWPLSEDMMIAMEKDLEDLADSVLCKFRTPGFIVLYLEEFINLLKDKQLLRTFWASKTSSGDLWDLLENNPFFKPPAIRKMLMTGIHEACDSQFDKNDTSAVFKDVLEKETADWVQDVLSSGNQVMIGTPTHVASVAAATQGAPPAKKNLTTAPKISYQKNLKSLSEFMCNHCKHATSRTFIGWPRQQLTQSLDELEVGAAAVLATYVVKVLVTLAKKRAFTGMLKSTWEAYKCFKKSGAKVLTIKRNCFGANGNYPLSLL